MGCSMLFSAKPADAGLLYAEEGFQAAEVSLLFVTISKLCSFFVVVFEKQFVISTFAVFRPMLKNSD